MKLHVLKGLNAGKVVEVPPAGFTIGRVPDNDLMLDEEGVSRHHCRISQVGGSWMIEDLNSVNGVRVNGERIEGSGPIQEGDEIAILGNLLLFTEEGAAATPGGSAPEDRRTTVPAWAQSAPADDVAAVPARAPLPWARLGLLGVVVALIVVIAVVVFSGSGDEASDADAEAGAVEQQQQVPAFTDTVPEELSDTELAKLIEEEEKGSDATPAVGDVTDDQEPPATPIAQQSAALAHDAEAAPSRIVDAGEPADGADRAVTDLVLIDSKPTGAQVFVDGKEFGVTPTIVRGLKPGRHMVALKLAGYEDFDRQIHVPDVLPSRPYVLRQRAGTLLVESTPSGASVWHGTQLLGTTPALISWLPPGTYELRVIAPGCEPHKQTVTVSEIRGESVSVALHSLLGSMEIRSEPPGCSISVDGLFKGSTVPAEDGGRVSAPFRLDGLPAADHLVRVEHPSGASRSGRIRVNAGEVTRQNVRLWVPDCRLVLNDGSSAIGMLIETNEHGDVVLEEKPRQYERYMKPRIVEVKMLTPEQTKEILDRLRGVRKPDGGAAERLDDDEDRDGGRRAEGAGADPGATDGRQPEGDVWGDQEEAGAPAEKDGVMRLTSKELRNLLRNSNNTDLHNTIMGKTIVLTAVPTSAGRDGLGGYIAFGRRVRCFVDREHFAASSDRIRVAIETEGPITVRGVGAGVRGDTVIVRECALVTEGE
jgi:pSer/pThr/pTyr-binding forkhead associated (FHA) protein